MNALLSFRGGQAMNQLSIIKEMCACSWLEREKYIKRRGEENSFKKERWRKNLIKKKCMH
jgi:hypothetical protein